METIKRFCLTLVEWVKQVFLLPQALSNAVGRRRRRILLDEREAERIDRLRNPSKYLGK